MFFKKNKKITVALSLGEEEGPWGGANQFTKIFSKYLKERGYRVVYKLSKDVDFVWLLDARLKSWSDQKFTWKEILELKKIKPNLICAHRLNNCDARKPGSNEIDKAMLEGDKVSDYTIFLSRWLRNYFQEKGFNSEKPHRWIWNGGDPQIFKFKGGCPWDGSGTFKLITHHWSDNWGKGFRLYEKIDQMIFDGILNGFSLTICGKWPKEIEWKTARLIEPLVGEKLASLLREHHGYVTGSKAEPGGMHFLEGMQCGLPIAAAKEGGGIVEVIEEHGIVFEEEQVGWALLEMRRNYAFYRKKALLFPHDGEIMCYQYFKVMEALLAEKGIL